MLIIPAIDLIDGKPVRLVQGDYSTSHSVAKDALEQALSFQNQGAGFLHVVDLDGAKAGHPVNLKVIESIAKALSIPVEVGGGVREEKDIQTLLDLGVSRVILGTRAIEDPSFLKKMAEKYPDRIVLGLDCRDGRAATRGWESDGGRYYLDVVRDLEDSGIRTVIFTDISRDGMLNGPNLEMLKALKEASKMDIIASGGVGTMDDLISLQELGVDGAIIGKALYTGDVDLKEALKHAQ